MKKTITTAMLLAGVAVFCGTATLFAQQLSDLNENPYSSLQDNKSKSSFSLFDPSKLRMRQSYTFGYYSGGGSSGTIGYYLNSIEYAISNPLRVRVDLGFLHNPAALVSKNSSLSNSGTFVPGFSLDWRPVSSFHLRLDYRQLPTYYYGGYNGYFDER
jgi:hypothetical protein